MNSSKKKSFADILIPLLTFILFLFIWQLFVDSLNISKLILPSPILVIKALLKNFVHLLTNGFITLYESVSGFLLGGFSAILLATMFQFSKTSERAIYPYAIAIRAVPLVALAPLIIVWLGTGYFSKIVLAAIISFFPILVTMIRGLNSVEPDAIDMLTTFSASKWQIFKKVRFPSSLPYLFSGMKVSSSFSVIGAIVAEFTGANQGIGYIIKSSSYYSDTDITFAAILIASLMGLMFFGAIVLAERYVIFWEIKVEST